MTEFFTTAQQVVIMLILMMLGFILTKTKVFSETGVKNMTDLVLYFVTPCVIIRSFSRPFDKDTLKSILISFACALGIHILSIIVAHLTIHSKDYSRECVLRYSLVFANCGYMALPLIEAIVGSEGVLYGTSFIAVFNLISWSYGIVLMSRDRRYISPKKMIANPGMIGIAVGLIIFLCSIKLPAVISQPVGYLANLNTPLPMLIIGYHLANSNIKKCITDFYGLFTVFMRLLVIPLAVLGLLMLCNIKGNMLLALILSVSSPVAANTTMFAAKFERDTELSVNMVSLSTVISVITIPIIVTVTKLIT